MPSPALKNAGVAIIARGLWGTGSSGAAWDRSHDQIHILHENPAWLPPLAEAFDRNGLPWNEWFLHEGTFDLAAPPPPGVFYNRMSASSHTRDHRYSAELTAAVLAWLTRWGRRVVNGPALDLEISKVRQYAALNSTAWPTPRTVLVAGSGPIAAAAERHFPGQPVIMKPNRGGKGLGVQLFASSDSLAAFVESDRVAAAGRWPDPAAGVCPRAASGDHPGGIRRRPVPLCGGSRYQRRLRIVPGRRLRDRR